MAKLLFLGVCISFALLSFCENAKGFLNGYPWLESIPLTDGQDPGTPLILTPLIQSGKIDEAREKAIVQHKSLFDVSSYSGYLTVNKEYNSNTFFWFFPAQVNPTDAPVLLWLTGGPGSTSLLGLFLENGPFVVKSNKTIALRQYSWTNSHNVVYFDNPVGTGFSFTDNDEGLATDETDVSRDVLTALVQFFQLFPELQQNSFYVTGESYAGKYIPAVSHAIKDFNVNAEIKINLKGLSIGNGFSDPVNQLLYGDYLYQIGLIDFNGRELFHAYEKEARELIQQEKFKEAFGVIYELVNSSSTSGSLFTNLTGFNFYYNFLRSQPTDEYDRLNEWVQQADIRRAIHVGNSSFAISNSTVSEYLINDIMQSVAYLVSDLTQHYKILIYSGQLDIIVAYPLTENFLQNLIWPGAEEYKTAPRKQWWVENDIAGYSKTVGNLTEVLVRNAGHMVPADQPLWALDLITRFTHNIPF